MSWLKMKSGSQKADIKTYAAQIAAINRVQAIIEFSLDGTILDANENFLNAMGYTLDEIKGKHHSIFVDPDYRQSAEYKRFWERLGHGEYDAGEYKRFGKGGREVWIQASYNPILNDAGKPIKVMKFATDITAQKQAFANYEGQMQAISKAQAVIEFALDGKILDANENFLKVMGYSLAEIKGQHHAMFVEPDYRESVEYKLFWEKLARGEFVTAQCKRITKAGKEVWIQANYNPILDASGRPYKVVKYATDVTEQKHAFADYEGQIKAVHRSRGALEMTLDGKITFANENFLKPLGYTLDEVKGRHHSIFVTPQERDSAEYDAFWKSLNEGRHQSGHWHLVSKDGRDLWFQANYNPILDLDGKPFKVATFATDVTADKYAQANFQGQLDAINKAQAVIEFTTDGKILNANENFLKAVGYTLDEVKGKHHSIFVDPTYRQSVEYKMFWEKLSNGEYEAGQFKRFGKNGELVWLQATYNPILDLSGKPFKVVKYAMDITADKLIEAEIDRIVQAAVNGNFDNRIALDGKKSSLANVAQSINMLCENTAQVMGDLVGMFSALAKGDFTQRIHTDYQGQFGRLKDDANAMADRIASTIAEIKVAAREVTDASAEISTSTTDLSQRTEEQAASLEETSASMEQISAMVKKNAENAIQAKDAASGTRQVADHGGEVVSQAVGAMARIEQSSHKISDIIGVIDEIARQTNLLALNAAVEAARAGEAGRGFAVVASEVRSLAQRSSQAAKDIKDLITSSNTQVKDGVELVNKAGEALNDIVESTKRVAEIVAEIASASAEQASGIEQVNKALAQMDEATQQNSALVEENAATAKTLEQQAKAMDERVSFFRIDANERDAGMWPSESIFAPAPVKKPAAMKRPVTPAKPARPPQKAAPAAATRGGPVGRMQSALASAIQDDPEWQEF